MSRSQALEYLGLADQDWGPCYTDNFTHAEFSAKWQGAKPCPGADVIAAASVASEQQATKEAFNASVRAQLAALDLKRIRPLAEGDTVYLASLNDRVIALRAQLV